MDARSVADSARAAVVDEIRAALGEVVAIYLFGSQAHGTAGAGSDLDVAVLPLHGLEAGDRFDLQERIASRVGRDVDLIDLTAATPVLAIQVVANGELLYDGDPAVRGRFEDGVFSAYARLNEERRGILERIAAEGTVHGR